MVFVVEVWVNDAFRRSWLLLGIIFGGRAVTVRSFFMLASFDPRSPSASSREDRSQDS